MPFSISNSFPTNAVFSPYFVPRSSITNVLFDFDGTLSSIREGRPAVIPDFRKAVPQL